MANVYVRSAAAGTGTGADWTNAFTTLAAALTAKAAGDTFWVSEDHAETAGSTKTLTSHGTAALPCNIYCVNHLGSVPPVSADLRTTATITSTGAFAVVCGGGWAYMYGITLNSGSGAVSVVAQIGSTNGGWVLENCSITNLGTGVSGAIQIGLATIPRSIYVKLKNTPLQFNNAGQAITIAGAKFVWENTANAIAGANIPTTLFKDASSAASGNVFIEGVDLSAITGNLVGAINGSKVFTFKDCKLASNVTVAQTPTNAAYAETYVLRSDSGATNYRNERYTYMGNQTVSTNIIMTGGASDGTTGLAFNLSTSANSLFTIPLDAMPIAIWNDTTGANVSATLEGVWNSANLPNNDDFWFDLEYLGNANTPIGTFLRGTKADGLATGTALTASTQAWDSQVTARGNSTAYVIGNVVKVASNAGRIFFCTANGTSSASEPVGYASALDGNVVADGTASFRAAVRFKMTLTASSPQPAQKGYMYAYCKAAKASSTFYINPKLALA